MFEYYPTGTCTKKITFTIEGNRLSKLHFYQGCDGNLKTLSRLLEGLPVDEIIEKLKGIQCGTKGTSCADQLATAIQAAMEKQPEAAARTQAADNRANKRP